MASHRKRFRRLQELEAAGSVAETLAMPLKWTGRRGEAFDGVVAELGGLRTARPKTIVRLLKAEFPEVTVQVQCMLACPHLQAGRVGPHLPFQPALHMFDHSIRHS